MGIYASYVQMALPYIPTGIGPTELSPELLKVAALGGSSTAEKSSKKQDDFKALPGDYREWMTRDRLYNMQLKEMRLTAEQNIKNSGKSPGEYFQSDEGKTFLKGYANLKSMITQNDMLIPQMEARYDEHTKIVNSKEYRQQQDFVQTGGSYVGMYGYDENLGATMNPKNMIKLRDAAYMQEQLPFTYFNNGISSISNDAANSYMGKTLDYAGTVNVGSFQKELDAAYNGVDELDITNDVKLYEGRSLRNYIGSDQGKLALSKVIGWTRNKQTLTTNAEEVNELINYLPGMLSKDAYDDAFQQYAAEYNREGLRKGYVRNKDGNFKTNDGEYVKPEYVEKTIDGKKVKTLKNESRYAKEPISFGEYVLDKIQERGNVEMVHQITENVVDYGVNEFAGAGAFGGKSGEGLSFWQAFQVAPGQLTSDVIEIGVGQYFEDQYPDQLFKLSSMATLIPDNVTGPMGKTNNFKPMKTNIESMHKMYHDQWVEDVKEINAENISDDEKQAKKNLLAMGYNERIKKEIKDRGWDKKASTVIKGYISENLPEAQFRRPTADEQVSAGWKDIIGKAPKDAFGNRFKGEAWKMKLPDGRELYVTEETKNALMRGEIPTQQYQNLFDISEREKAKSIMLNQPIEQLPLILATDEIKQSTGLMPRNKDGVKNVNTIQGWRYVIPGTGNIGRFDGSSSGYISNVIALMPTYASEHFSGKNVGGIATVEVTGLSKDDMRKIIGIEAKDDRIVETELRKRNVQVIDWGKGIIRLNLVIEPNVNAISLERDKIPLRSIVPADQNAGILRDANGNIINK